MFWSSQKTVIVRIVSALSSIAAAYLFMRSGWLGFPYNIPVICLTIIVAYLIVKRPLVQLGMQKIHQPLRFLLLGLGIAVAAELLMDWIVQPLINLLFNEPPDYSYFNKLEGNTALFQKYLLFTWLSAAFGEEILFRGFLFDQLNRALPPNKWRNIVVLVSSALLFAFAHGYEGPAGIAVTACWALLFGIIYLKTKNIWLVILVHGLIDSLFLLLAYYGQLGYYELLRNN